MVDQTSDDTGRRQMRLRCAIYTRKSNEEGLEQDFNSLDAQREACEAFIASQKHEGWIILPEMYDDGGFSGATIERPAFQRLLGDVGDGKIDAVIVYKVDRLTRSLSDFAKIVEIFDKRNVSFVSVTQQFNTTTSMGRLTLNILLSFAAIVAIVAVVAIAIDWMSVEYPLAQSWRRLLGLPFPRGGPHFLDS
jgi:DNA invertase Pin-like site-specific DNA recombinase